MSTAAHQPAVTTPVPMQTFVALGAIDPELVEPFLAPNQRLVLNPGAEELATADAAIVRAAFTVDKAMFDRMPALKVLARTGVGTDLVDVAEAARNAPVVTPVQHQCRAEGVFAHLLAAVQPSPMATLL
jgi:D-3-phosphoglycerate dehydrogenase/(S)-sulfolactate dehydrogenase